MEVEGDMRAKVVLPEPAKSAELKNSIRLSVKNLDMARQELSEKRDPEERTALETAVREAEVRGLPYVGVVEDSAKVKHFFPLRDAEIPHSQGSSYRRMLEHGVVKMDIDLGLKEHICHLTPTFTLICKRR
jgi:hypothetical protein